jgi:hypothetical protein
MASAAGSAAVPRVIGPSVYVRCRRLDRLRAAHRVPPPPSFPDLSLARSPPPIVLHALGPPKPFVPPRPSRTRCLEVSAACASLNPLGPGSMTYRRRAGPWLGHDPGIVLRPLRAAGGDARAPPAVRCARGARSWRVFRSAALQLQARCSRAWACRPARRPRWGVLLILHSSGRRSPALLQLSPSSVQRAADHLRHQRSPAACLAARPARSAADRGAAAPPGLHTAAMVTALSMVSISLFMLDRAHERPASAGRAPSSGETAVSFS